MEKILKILKKALITVGTFFITLPTKVFARTSEIPDILYGIPAPKNDVHLPRIMWNVSKVILIPLALIIGLIIYFIKSKKSLKNKIIISIIVIIMVTLIVVIADGFFEDVFYYFEYGSF